jgi:alanine racemase
MRSIEIDLGAIKHNYGVLKARFGDKAIMAVVKANAYGHGMHEVAMALEEVNVDALATADLSEAMELRMAGIRSRLMCWLVLPDDDFQTAKEQQIEIGVSNFEVLAAVPIGTKIHIKLDTGLGRNGFVKADWEQLFSALAGHDLIGVFTHLSNTSLSDDLKQRANFDAALAMAEARGLSGFQTHLSASAAALNYSEFDYDMVRVGLALCGQNPFEDQELDGIELRPAMRALSRTAGFKRVQAGQGVSYGYRYVAERATNLVLVPFGYAEGMPRISEGADVNILGKRYPVVGRVAMDQFVVEVGDNQIPIGSEVVIFGDPSKGEPSVDALAKSAKTVNYEIVTRIGGRANRVFVER